MNFACRFYCLFVEGAPASLAAMMVLPGKTRDIIACSRLVTLPDWQGLGLALALIGRLGSAYAAAGRRVHTYPAHPALIRSFDQSPAWRLRKRPGSISKRNRFEGAHGTRSNFGGRPNAVFEYAGPADREAAALVG